MPNHSNIVAATDRDRIYFQGNPWPEGHRIKDFLWTAETRGQDVWFHFHLVTDDYYAERDIEDDDDVEYGADWEAPIVWGNYHSCTISSTDWHRGGFRVCTVNEYSLERLDGLAMRVDPLPRDLTDHESLAFHTYLLGHDTVVDHMIKFVRVGETDSFNISWSGKIALTYVGDFEPCHQFSAEISSIKAPAL